MTIVLAMIVIFLIPDFPEEAKWLSDDEKAFVKARLAEDMGDAQIDAQHTWWDVLGVLKDLRVLLSGLTYFALAVPGYSYALFAPTILRSLGYTPVMTQLYSVPPVVAAVGLSMIAATLSDHYKRRYIFILPGLLISVTGIVILLNVHESVSVRYGALFLFAIGQTIATPIVICWFNANRESTSMNPSDFVI